MHLRKLPSGRWRVIVKHHGLQRTATADTKGKAQAMGAQLLLDLGRAPTGGTAILGEMLALHLAEQGYAATTAYDLGLVVAQLPEDVMAWRVSAIEPFDVEHLYRRLRKAGWTAHRIRKLHMLLSSAWTHRAGPYGWSSKTLMRSVTAPAVTIPEVRPPSDVDVRAILEQVDRGVALYLRLAADTGARRGELCGLQWPDVNPARREVVIRRSVAHVPGVERYAVSEGKTGIKGQRVIGVNPATAELLRTWSAGQSELAALAHITPLWVFSHNAGVDPWRGDYISREYRRARERAGVTDSHLHSLRHFMATRWLMGGEAAMIVAGRLGHANTATTLRTYAHYLGASDHAQAAQYGL